MKRCLISCLIVAYAVHGLGSSLYSDSPSMDSLEGSVGQRAIPIPLPDPRRQSQLLGVDGLNRTNLARVPLPQISSIRPGPLPEEVDLRIRFNEKVVESFTDHMLIRDNSQNLLRDLLFTIDGGKLRLSAIADFAKLSSAIAANQLSDYVKADYQERVAKGEIFNVAVDVEFELRTKEGTPNTVYLSWQRPKMNFFGFWVGSREEGAFKAYLRRNAIGREEAQASELEALQATVDRLEAKDNRTAAEDQQMMTALLQLRKLQTVEVARVPLQLGEEPIRLLMNEIVKAIGTEKITSAGIGVRYGYEDGVQTHLVEVSGLNGMFKTHLPDFSITHIGVDKRFMVFSGRLSE